MIFGTGVDIVQVNRLKKWVENPKILERFFNPLEMKEKGSESALCQHYAARFAAKEAFSKALGTGITSFGLKEVYITKNEAGKPALNVTGCAADVLNEKCGKYVLHVSLSHEKDYAIASVIIETV